MGNTRDIKEVGDNFNITTIDMLLIGITYFSFNFYEQITFISH